MRYYTPNGRSIDGTDELIQRQVDWDVYQTDEPQVQDSTAQANKGIEPDIIVETPDQTPIVRELVRRGVFSRFAIDYLQQANPEDSLNVGEEVVQAFQQYLESLRYEPGSQLIESVNSLEQMAEGQNLDAGFYNHLTELRNHVREYNQVALDTEDPWLVYFLTEALHWIADGEAGRIAATLPMDPVVQQSLSILEDAEAYSSYLEETDYTAVSSTP